MSGRAPAAPKFTPMPVVEPSAQTASGNGIQVQVPAVATIGPPVAASPPGSVPTSVPPPSRFAPPLLPQPAGIRAASAAPKRARRPTALRLLLVFLSPAITSDIIDDLHCACGGRAVAELAAPLYSPGCMDILEAP